VPETAQVELKGDECKLLPVPVPLSAPSSKLPTRRPSNPSPADAAPDPSFSLGLADND